MRPETAKRLRRPDPPQLRNANWKYDLQNTQHITLLARKQEPSRKAICILAFKGFHNLNPIRCPVHAHRHRKRNRKCSLDWGLGCWIFGLAGGTGREVLAMDCDSWELASHALHAINFTAFHCKSFGRLNCVHFNAHSPLRAI